jgi:hypothetical protein
MIIFYGCFHDYHDGKYVSINIGRCRHQGKYPNDGGLSSAEREAWEMMPGKMQQLNGGYTTQVMASFIGKMM